VRPTPVKLVSIGHFSGDSSSRILATFPVAAGIVDPSAFAAALFGFAALRNPTLIRCFHSSRSCLGG